MRKMRLILVALSPLLIWGSAPLKVGLNAIMISHLATWLYGTFCPNSCLFGSVFSRGGDGKKWVGLTFDDGPSELHSPRVLDTLRNHGAKATFFVVGRKAAARPDLVRRIHEEGHLVGNHTWSHPPHMAFEGLFGRRAILEEIERAQGAIEAIIGERPQVFRPPQGFKNHLILEACRDQGITLVGYSQRPPYHANGHDSAALAERIVQEARPGSIINFHDGWRTGREWDCEEMIGTLSRIIVGLRVQGYQFVTVREMIEEGEAIQPK
jgi:peptidoglycan-N-acetylglucosamine deacetylase